MHDTQQHPACSECTEAQLIAEGRKENRALLLELLDAIGDYGGEEKRKAFRRAIAAVRCQ